MTFVITAVRGSNPPTVVNTPGMDEAGARDWCRNLAANGMSKVTLHSLSDAGLIEPVCYWTAGGKRARQIASNGSAAPVEQPTDEAPKRRTRRTQKEEQQPAAEDETPEVTAEDEQSISAAAEADDTEQKEYDAFCVKCQEKRTFSAREYKEMKNGTLMAKGKCPVCDTGINRILPKGTTPPEPEWHDDEKETDNVSVTVSVEDGEAHVEVEGEPHVEDVAEAVQEAAEAVVEAPEFSDADREAVQQTSAALNEAAKAALSAKAAPAAKKAPAKKATPAKRTNKKAGDDQQAIPTDVKDFQNVASCPKCGRKQPVKEVSGLTVFMTHSAPGLDECPGSRATIN